MNQDNIHNRQKGRTVRTSILESARSVLTHRPPADLTLDEIAATLGVKCDHVRAYFGSVNAIGRTLDIDDAFDKPAVSQSAEEQ